MTKLEGYGVRNIVRLAEGALKRMPRDEARSFVDGLTNSEIAHVAMASSLAEVSMGGTGNLVAESMAARLLGVDVESVGSDPDAAPLWDLPMPTHSELVGLQFGSPPCKAFSDKMASSKRDEAIKHKWCDDGACRLCIRKLILEHDSRAKRSTSTTRGAR